MISVQKLSKNFGSKAAVSSVSFEVKDGEILGFLGPNGAGKTTTMRILTGFLPATSGKAILAGYDVTQSPLEVRKRLGYLPETAPVYPEMRVREFLDFSASLKGLEGALKKKQIEKVMEQTSLTKVSRELMGQLSKGYRQRVGLAQALVSDPPILILDEPTVGLDPKQIIEIRDLIKSLAGEHTIILSTHILPEVSMTCERVIIINEGHLVASDTPEALTQQLQKSAKVLIVVKGPSREVQKALKTVRGVLSVELKEPTETGATYIVDTKQDAAGVRAALAQKIVKKGYDLLEMRLVGMSLEDIFIRLVTDEKGNGE